MSVESETELVVDAEGSRHVTVTVTDLAFALKLVVVNVPDPEGSDASSVSENDPVPGTAA